MKKREKEEALLTATRIMSEILCKTLFFQLNNKQLIKNLYTYI